MLTKKLFLVIFLLFLLPFSFSQNQPSYNESTKFNLIFLKLNFNVSNNKLLNLSIQKVTNLSIEEIRSYLPNLVLNNTSLYIKNDSKEWTRVALMAWNKNGYPTVLFQTFQLGQKITIQATGCKHGHCKTVYKTAGSADNILVLWSCKSYDFLKFQGAVDLRNCRISNILPIMPFVYGSGTAKKENIKTKIFTERDFGEINKYFNTSLANLYAINGFFN